MPVWKYQVGKMGLKIFAGVVFLATLYACEAATTPTHTDDTKVVCYYDSSSKTREGKK